MPLYNSSINKHKSFQGLLCFFYKKPYIQEKARFSRALFLSFIAVADHMDILPSATDIFIYRIYIRMNAL